jgi:hypothetical protein
MPNGKKIGIVRRIQDAGYLREFDTALHLNLPRLTIEMNPWHSFAFDYRGGMGVILELRITSNRKVRIQDFGDLELLERPCNMVWWVNEGSNFYKFDQGPEYPHDAVLNHLTGKHVMVKPGQPLEGVLLGHSTTRIPSKYSHGFKLPLMWTILDGFDTPHTAQLHVQVDECLCSKIRRPSRSSLQGPWSGNKASKRRDEADTNGSEVDSAEPRPGGRARTRA